MTEEDGFKLVEKKDGDGFTGKKRKNRKNNKFKVNLDKSIDDHMNSLKDKKDTMEKSKFLQELRKNMKELGIEKGEIKTIRCLALGSPIDTACSSAAMYQLALLQLIQSDLEVKKDNISVYDPVFEPMDLELFQKLGYAISETDPEDIINDHYKNCLFYMPHAPTSLTNEILANREIKMIIGNNIPEFDTRINDEKAKEYPFLKEAIDDLLGDKVKYQAIAINNKLAYKEHYFQAVNDLAITIRK
ncbi:hypothetical protein TRVA0_010S01244 [Trichomonascus vanleenenianus]|uniref:Ber1p n=1 Tax=Trichomonascus vanleenenianus TaxID=2268995 RepID=UPI003EC97DD1